jgi:hypothetical protein
VTHTIIYILYLFCDASSWIVLSRIHKCHSSHHTSKVAFKWTSASTQPVLWMWWLEICFDSLQTSERLCYRCARWVNCYNQVNKLWCSNQEEWDGQGIWHVWGSGEAYKGFRCANLAERDHFEDLGIDGRIILKLFIRKCGMKWSGSGEGQMAGSCEKRHEPLDS